MTSIPDCLAAFSVAAMMNNPGAAAKARAAIDAYLECAPPQPAGRRAALHELYAAYLELALDSCAALDIRDDLERRIVELAALPAEKLTSPVHERQRPGRAPLRPDHASTDG